ncbi:uracil phosphoribosyltransferase [Sarocladium implicatum]|nr:uracil phosphoribosyltransferase [Sarocladium implicatum]
MGKLNTAIKTGQTAIELGRNAQTFAAATHDIRHADKADLGRQAGRHAFNEASATGTTVGKSWLKTFEVIPRLAFRSMQFLFAIITIGFYGNRVDADRKDGEGYSAEWLYAIIVGGASSVTAILFVAAATLSSLPYIGSKLKMLKAYRAFWWDLTLFIAWIVVFGIFAGIFLKRDDDDGSYKGAKTGAMKVAVWMDLINAILWLVSGVYGGVKTFLGGKLEEGTAKVGEKLFRKKDKTPKKEAEYAESV